MICQDLLSCPLPHFCLLSACCCLQQFYIEADFAAVERKGSSVSALQIQELLLKLHIRKLKRIGHKASLPGGIRSSRLPAARAEDI